MQPTAIWAVSGSWAPSATRWGVVTEENQPAPWRTARRSAAGELPPIRIGGTSAPRGERDRRARRQLDRLAVDQPGQERERLVGAAATFGVGDADGLPCLGAMHDATSADAEHDAAAGDVLQCGELLGGPRGIAQGCPAS